MLRAALIFSTILYIPAFAQSSEIRGRLAAQQNLIHELSAGMTRYTPRSPELSKRSSFIRVLENQAKLIQLPREQWQPDTVQKQFAALTLQVERLRIEVSNYMPNHPSLVPKLAIIDFLERELHSLSN